MRKRGSGDDKGAMKKENRKEKPIISDDEIGLCSLGRNK